MAGKVNRSVVVHDLFNERHCRDPRGVSGLGKLELLWREVANEALRTGELRVEGKGRRGGRGGGGGGRREREEGEEGHEGRL